MTPRQLGGEVEVAYHGRAEDTHRRCLARLVALASTGPTNLAALTIEQLDARRNELHVQLAAVNDQLLRMNSAGRRTRVLRDGWLRDHGESIEPSDPTG